MEWPKVTEENLPAVAGEIIAHLLKNERATVLCFEGDLGAGKTALTKAIARTLGIGEEITSPTFVLMKVYDIVHHEIFKRLIHIDAYRIESADEMRVLHLEEMFDDPHTLVIIEWPENIRESIPSTAKRVSISINEDTTRRIVYHHG